MFSLLLSFSSLCLAQEPPVPAALTAQELAVREQNAGGDPVKLLALCRLAAPDDARRLRKMVFQRLKERRKTDNLDELQLLTRMIAEALPKSAPTPVEAAEVLGEPKSISRQIVYRRYLEAWTFDQNVTVTVVFQWSWGQEPVLIQANPVSFGEK